MKKLRKILGGALVVCMMLGIIPASVSAAGYTTWTIKYINVKNNNEVLAQTGTYTPNETLAGKLNGLKSPSDMPLSALDKYSLDGTKVTAPAGYSLALGQYGPEPATVYLDGTIEIKVTPEIEQFSVQVNYTGNGSTLGGTGLYEKDSEVTVRAIPTEDSHFLGWKENGIVVSKEIYYTFNITQNRVLTAEFEDCVWSEWSSNGQNQHTRTCEICSKSQTENCGGGQGDCVNKPVCTVCGAEYVTSGLHNLGTLIPQEDSTYEKKGMKAHYECGLCGTLFDEDKQETTEKKLEIPRKPKMEWNLVFWDEAKGHQVPSSYKTITIPQKTAEAIAKSDTIWNGGTIDTPFSNIGFDESTIPEDYKLVRSAYGPEAASVTSTDIIVYVEKITYEVTVNVVPEEGGTAEGGGIYEVKEEVTVTAVPNKNYHFLKWTENGTDISSDVSYTFRIKGDRNLTAVFGACDWSEWSGNHDGTHTRECSVCKDTDTESCSGGKATCIEKAVCEVCGECYGEVEPDNHTDVAKTEAKAATHMKEGNIAYWYCSGCEKYFSDEELKKEVAFADTVIPKLEEHTADVGKWEYNGKTHWNRCECGEKLNEAKHKFKCVTDKVATTKEKGLKHEECTVCGYKKAAVEIPVVETKPAEKNPVVETKPVEKKTAVETKKDKAADAPKTGDNSNVIGWFVFMLVTCSGIAGVVIYRRKKYGE